MLIIAWDLHGSTVIKEDPMRSFYTSFGVRLNGTDLNIYDSGTLTLPAPPPDFKIEEFKLMLEEYLMEIPVDNCVEKIICFGPSQVGPNILINNIPRFDTNILINNIPRFDISGTM